MDAATGLCSTAVKTSKVFMRDYSDAEIAAYVESGEPFDKAGGYAAQDETFRPAEGIEGCYPNVVGLPICDVLTLLERIGAPARFKARLAHSARLPRLRLLERHIQRTAGGEASMSFLGMGTMEILIILLVAFIFLGPERMIDAATNARQVDRRVAPHGFDRAS